MLLKRPAGMAGIEWLAFRLDWSLSKRREAALIGTIPRHLRHHQRFYAAFAVGLVLWAVLGRLAPAVSLVAAGDGFFAAYLALQLMFAARLTVADMRRYASFDDEGIFVVVLITLTAILLSMLSIFATLNQSPAPDPLRLGLAVASVPLGWFTFHTVAAFRYAHLYYTKLPDGDGARDAGGLGFPETQDPTSWDFLYYAFVIGMTAQVSDVQVLSTAMRRTTLLHSVASFFFNTVILALAVNMAVVQRF